MPDNIKSLLGRGERARTTVQVLSCCIVECFLSSWWTHTILSDSSTAAGGCSRSATGVTRGSVTGPSCDGVERRMVDITRDKPIKVAVRVQVPVRDHPKVSLNLTGTFQCELPLELFNLILQVTWWVDFSTEPWGCTLILACNFHVLSINLVM